MTDKSNNFLNYIIVNNLLLMNNNIIYIYINI